MPVGKPGARLAMDVGIPDSPLRPTHTDHSSDPGWRPGQHPSKCLVKNLVLRPLDFQPGDIRIYP